MFKKFIVRSKLSRRIYRMPQQQSLGRFFASTKKDGDNIVKKVKLEATKPVQQDPIEPLKGPVPDTEMRVQNSVEDKSNVATEAGPKSLDKENSTASRMNEKDAAKLVELTEKVDPILEGANAAKGAKIPYSALTDTFDKVENTSKRLEITAYISELFLEVLKKSDIQTLTKIVYLCVNRLGPDYEPDLELGLGETILIKAISQCYGRAASKIKQDLVKVGDLGSVAQNSRASQRTMFQPQSLDSVQVFEDLMKISKTVGKDSQGRKISTIIKLLTACSPKTSEAKYLVRSLEGKLRIGLAEATVLVALSQALLMYQHKNVTPDMLAKAEDIMKEAFVVKPNYEMIIQTAYEGGILNLMDYISLSPGVPPKPMLAKPSKSITEVLDRFSEEEFTCEYKYDGERAQIHYIDGQVKIFSRNSENVSERYPDLIEFLQQNFTANKIQSLIMDSEVVAWDVKHNKILPFQVLSTRKRKGVNVDEITVKICVFAFDLLFFNGESFLRKTLRDRRKTLFDALPEIPGKYQYATHKNSRDVSILQEFLDQSVKDACEGLMVKVLDGTDSFYEPSKRTRNWLKLKKDYLQGVGDSLDLVVIGAYLGKGKRTGAYGGFLLACYNQDTGEYETTCKIGTGFSDEVLASLYTRLKPTESPKPKAFYVYDTTNSNAVPDVWFEPTTIFEVLVADLSLSPVYKAAHTEYSKGISLRFPRFIRLRDDKAIEDATSSDQISEFYRRQANLN